jgi:hypothetical protein
METRMAGGWLVGVMVTEAGQPEPVRHYFAVGFDEQARAEWTAIDRALQLGHVATSPVGGAEPVQTLRHIPPQRMRTLGLQPGEVRALGWKHPRLWLS